MGGCEIGVHVAIDFTLSNGDPRVPQSESDQIVAELRKRNKSVEYLLFPDEGHGFVRTENNLQLAAEAEDFLGRYLGGRVEPAGKIPGSSGVSK